MAKFLVGEDNKTLFSKRTTWTFASALEAASDGDEIHLMPSYSPMEAEALVNIHINKSIKITGTVIETQDGNSQITNQLPRIMVQDSAVLTLENIMIVSDEERINLINVKQESKLIANNIFIESKVTNNNGFPVIAITEKSSAEISTLLVNTYEENSSNLSVYINNSDAVILDSVINTKVSLIDGSLNLANSEINNNFSNTFFVRNSNIEIHNSVLLAGSKSTENSWPAIALSNSSFNISNLTVNQPKFDSAMSISNSKGSINYSVLDSLKISSTTLNSNFMYINESLAITDSSKVSVENLLIAGLDNGKINLFTSSKSIVNIDLLTFGLKSTPNIKCERNTEINIEEIILAEYSTSGFTVDENEDIVVLEHIEDFDDIHSQIVYFGELSAFQKLDNLVGVNQVKIQVKEFIAVAEMNKKRTLQGASNTSMSLHSLFLGNPGTGKTTVARLIGDILYDKGIIKKNIFIEATRPDLVAEYIGQSAVKTRAVLESALGGVLFIDEAYTLSTGGDKDFGLEVINEILTFMENNRDDIVIIFAGYTDDMETFLNSNDGLRSRIPNRFTFEDYSPYELYKIGSMDFDYKGYKYDKKLYEKFVWNQFTTSGDNSNGRWIRNLNESIERNLALYLSSNTDNDIFIIPNSLFSITNENIWEQRENSKPKQSPTDVLNNLVGIESVKTELSEFIAITEMNAVRSSKGLSNSDISLHSLFLGNPGTGKTTVARILGEILFEKKIVSKNIFVEVSRVDLVGQYLGQTAVKTRNVLKSALGGVLFIDEAYSLVGNTINDYGLEAIMEILTFMENNRGNIVIIFAGYSKDMERFLEMNEGLKSRIPNTFVFPDYTVPELVTIGINELKSNDYLIDEKLYSELVSHNFILDNDRSNGRWIRNLNSKLVKRMAVRLSKSNSPDYTNITDDDINSCKI